MPILTKTQRVLDLHGCSLDGEVMFKSDGEVEGRVAVVRFEESAWEDMGRPAQVTITIAPGDLLNG